MEPVMTTSSPEIRTVQCGTPEFNEVVALWGQHRRWLGLFPEGAFEDYAEKEGIVAAIAPEGHVLGYLAFRISKGWAHIVHLCIRQELRRKSVARKLVNHLEEHSRKFQQLGLRLKCRRDYPANGFWPKVGFVARAESLGRGDIPQPLTVWVKRHPDVPDLFSSTVGADSQRLVAVLDANTFYDLAHEDADPDSLSEGERESLQLCSGWVQDAVELCVVDEIFQEINRNSLRESREDARARASRYRELPAATDLTQQYYHEVQQILGWLQPKAQRHSDMMQIAKAAAAGATFFVTRDKDLLRKAEQIESLLKIRVISPNELTMTLDQQERQHLYSPSRLRGTDVKVRQATGADLSHHCEAFLGRNPQEPQNEFLRLAKTLGAQCAGTQNRSMQIMEDQSGNPILLAATCKDECGQVRIPLLRTSSHRLSSTAARHALLVAIQEAANRGGKQVMFSDAYIGPSVAEALNECGFVPLDGSWTRHLISQVIPLDKLGEALPPGEKTSTPIGDLERRYWPLKVRGGNVPCCMLPIRQSWAGKLFSHDLAAQELFPAEPLPALNRENIFYRSVRNWRSPEPVRLLWYVSGTNSVRACSRLLQSQRGPAKVLFKRFEHLGVYGWREVLRLAGDDPNGDIMVLHFTDTEVFDRPVSLGFLREIGTGTMLQGPSLVSEDQFFQIYTQGLSRFHEK